MVESTQPLVSLWLIMAVKPILWIPYEHHYHSETSALNWTTYQLTTNWPFADPSKMKWHYRSVNSFKKSSRCSFFLKDSCWCMIFVAAVDGKKNITKHRCLGWAMFFSETAQHFWICKMIRGCVDRSRVQGRQKNIWVDSWRRGFVGSDFGPKELEKLQLIPEIFQGVYFFWTSCFLWGFSF